MADELILTISGEDGHLGDRNIPFVYEYTVTCNQEVDITVTETLDSVLQLRTYTTNANSEQQAEVAADGLSQGEHTLTITATAGDVSATRELAFTLPVTYLSPIEADLGSKGERFAIPYMAKTYSGVEIKITEKLDGKTHREYTVVSGAEQEMTVNTEKLTDTEHEVEIIATGDGETKSAKSVFRVAPIILSDGGSVQELQGYDGKPVYPATIAKAVTRTNGFSVESSLKAIEKQLFGLWDTTDVCMEKITASGVWKAPKAVDQKFRVVCVGGGGSGAGTGSNSSGCGGGGSGYIEIKEVVVPAGEDVEVVCGAGGAASAGEGNSGGTTSFGNYFSAEGGGPGRIHGRGGNGGNGNAGGGGGGQRGGDGGNGGEYGGGGGGGYGSYSTAYTVTGNGGSAGEYGGGGGGGVIMKGSASTYGTTTGGAGGKFGGAGGSTIGNGSSRVSSPGEGVRQNANVAYLDTLFNLDFILKTSAAGAKGNGGSGGGAGVKSAGGKGGEYGGGGGGGFCGDGGAGTNAGGGGGGFCGNGGSAANSSNGGGGGGGFFCNGGQGTIAGGGGGGFFSDGATAYSANSVFYGGAGGNGGVLIIYQKEEEKE